MFFFRVISFIFSASSGEDCKRLLRNFVDWFLKLIRVALKRFCVVSLLSTLAFTDLPCETEEWLKQRSRKIDYFEDGDIKNPSHYCMATINMIAGHWLCIQYDGIGESAEFDFCCSFQEDALFLIEWWVGHGHLYKGVVIDRVYVLCFNIESWNLETYTLHRLFESCNKTNKL